MRQSISSLKKTEILMKILEKLSCQDWPDSTLYVVATPIGNLSDLGLRAWETLMRVDLIAAEDTRISQILLNSWGIKTTPLLIANKHNEVKMSKLICKHLSEGSSIALISDAGTPGISDPGGHIVCSVREFGYRVIPIPGANAIATALMASGAITEKNPSYIFAGFIPKKSQERANFLRFWCHLPATVVMFETAPRLSRSLDDLITACGLDRLVTIARELTKYFESIRSFKLKDAQMILQDNTLGRKGEFVLIIHTPEKTWKKTKRIQDQKVDNLLNVLLEEFSVRDSVRVTAKLTSFDKKDLYRQALAILGKNNI